MIIIGKELIPEGTDKFVFHLLEMMPNIILKPSYIIIDCGVEKKPLFYGDKFVKDKEERKTEFKFDFPYILSGKNSLTIKFGGAGFTPKLEHELAHIVEIKDIRRTILPDLGMPVVIKKAKSFIPAFHREIQTRVIELCISGSDKKVNLHKHSSWGTFQSGRHAMSGFQLPHRLFKDYKEFCLWSEEQEEKLSRSWNRDRIEIEWICKINYIQEWQASQP